MLNRCEFIGRLGKDPEVRAMNNGDSVVNLSLGVSEKWKDKNTGEQREKTEWVKVVEAEHVLGINKDLRRSKC